MILYPVFWTKYQLIYKSIHRKLSMPRLMQQKNGQYLLTIPRAVARALQARKGEKIDFIINLKKGVVELIKE